MSNLIAMYTRVGKIGSLGPWSSVIVYRSKLSFHQNDPQCTLIEFAKFGMEMVLMEKKLIFSGHCFSYGIMGCIKIGDGV